MQDIDWVGDVPTTAARVVAGAPSNFSHTVEIDKGTDDGVREGMPVITGAGLAGKVVQARGGRPTVQLITDPASTNGRAARRERECPSVSSTVGAVPVKKKQ